MDGLQPGEILGRDDRQQTDERPREDETEQAARDREHKALDDELLREPPQGRAERGPHGHLALTRVPAREQQVRNVRAGPEEHQRHAGHQQDERGTDVLGHLFDEGADADLHGTTLAQYLIEVRRTGDAARCRRPLRRRLFAGDAGPQAGEGAHHADPPRCRIGRLRRHALRQPEGRIPVREGEARWRDTDDEVRPLVQDERLPNRRRTRGVEVPPQAVSEHDDTACPFDRVVIVEEPPDGRLHAQQAKQRRRHDRAWHPRGVFAADGESEAVAERRRVLDRLRGRHPGIASEVAEQRAGPLRRGAARMLLGDTYELLGLGVRQRPEQDAVNDRKHGRVRANAQRERQQHSGTEPLVLGHHSKGLPNVAPHRFHRGTSDYLAFNPYALAPECYKTNHTCVL